MGIGIWHQSCSCSLPPHPSRLTPCHLPLKGKAKPPFCRRGSQLQRLVQYRPRREAVQGSGAPTNKGIMELRYAPARPMWERRFQTKTTLRGRGESRGGDSPQAEFWHPLWPSLLLSRERERRTQTKVELQIPQFPSPHKKSSTSLQFLHSSTAEHPSALFFCPFAGNLNGNCKRTCEIQPNRV